MKALSYLLIITVLAFGWKTCEALTCDKCSSKIGWTDCGNHGTPDYCEGDETKCILRTYAQVPFDGVAKEKNYERGCSTEDWCDGRWTVTQRPFMSDLKLECCDSHDLCNRKGTADTATPAVGLMLMLLTAVLACHWI
ncbi:uncharacterized protein [Branchiostoma lanceolatum]|uniref:uncharacterized protein n=1 Tax=Branchiostoma lanceolatum TaxID=7740 RepID=UPI00345579EC